MNIIDTNTFGIKYTMGCLSKKINECEVLSSIMKAISSLVLMVNIVYSKEGNIFVTITSLIAIIIFFFIDGYFLKRMRYYEIKLKEVTKKYMDDNSVEDICINLPIVYYLLIIVILVFWLMKIP